MYDIHIIAKATTTHRHQGTDDGVIIMDPEKGQSWDHKIGLSPLSMRMVLGSQPDPPKTTPPSYSMLQLTDQAHQKMAKVQGDVYGKRYQGGRVRWAT